MPLRRSVSGSKAAVPARLAQAPTAEVLYNTAVQAFVRRDHVKTQATLARLLAQLKPTTVSSLPPWYDLDTTDRSQLASGGGEAGEELLVKTLKLVISANTSLYTDPPQHTAGLPAEITPLLPPASPEQLLAYTQGQLSPFCSDLIPPALLSTLLLASLKLKPASEALDYAHQVAEDWFTALPDAFILAIAPAAPSRKAAPSVGSAASSAERKKQVESAREGYLKVVELFVGEVLAREGEFEMARAFLDGEIVMSSKRKESLYRHLRSAETRAAASPSSSLILPSPTASGVLVPNPSPGSNSAGGQRSRSASTSSSSSEATARPQVGGAGGVSGYASGAPSPASRTTARDPPSALRGTASGVSRQLLKSLGAGSGNKGKSRAVALEGHTDEADSTPGTAPSLTSDSTLPSKIYINHPSSEASTSAAGGNRPQRRDPYRRGNRGGPGANPITSAFLALLSALPTPLARRLSRMGRYTLLGLTIPLPIILLVSLMVWVRRKQQRVAAALAAGAAEGAARAAVAGGAVTPSTLTQIRDKVRRAREEGLLIWLKWFLRWWIDKFVGVWRMGTTITYV